MARVRIAKHPKRDENEPPHEKFNKSEAMRRALAEGVDQPTNGVAFIKSRFGLDISPTYFIAIKSTERKKAHRLTFEVARGRKPAGDPQKATANVEADLLAAMEA